MATIVGIIELGKHFGTINTFASDTRTVNFGKSSILATPWLQGFSVNSDEGGVGLSVLKFTDGNGVHTGPFLPGVFANGCTSVTFNMATNDCIADAIFRIYFFG